jgi:hypothetical protein
MNRTARRLIFRTALFVAVLGTGAIALQARNYHGRRVTSAMPQPHTGREIVMVFIGSTDCAPSRQPGFNKVVQQVAHNLHQTAGSRGMAFSRIGVALSGTPAEGMKFLSDFGTFEETVTGRGWMNSGAISFVWRDLPGSSAVPQLLVLQRRIAVSPRGIRVSPDSVILRLTGVSEIRSWTAAGSPLD